MGKNAIQTLSASLILALGLTTPLIASAESPEEKGLAIAIEADKRDTGWKDSVSDLVMILQNKNGEKSVRDLRIKAFEMEDDGDKSLTIFDEPKDVRGTALLTFSHKEDSDDQWLYLPAVKRVKRIASKNKSGPFMGSEFAFEDLSSQEVEKYTYKFLRDEPCPGFKDTCFVLERYPKDENSGYTKQIAWMDHSEYRLHKVEYYDRKKSLLKTLTTKNFKQYLGKYWRADYSLMVNHQTGKSTVLDIKKLKFRNYLKESDFSKNSLKRAR